MCAASESERIVPALHFLRECCEHMVDVSHVAGDNSYKNGRENVLRESRRNTKKTSREHFFYVVINVLYESCADCESSW